MTKFFLGITVLILSLGVVGCDNLLNDDPNPSGIQGTYTHNSYGHKVVIGNDSVTVTVYGESPITLPSITITPHPGGGINNLDAYAGDYYAGDYYHVRISYWTSNYTINGIAFTVWTSGSPNYVFDLTGGGGWVKS